MRIDRVEPRRVSMPRVGPFRTSFGTQTANTAYRLGVAHDLAELDYFGLLLIEQPLPEDDVAGHAALAKLIRACAIENIKVGPVGGYLEARRVHDVCAALGVPAWCGGMLESGLGLGVRPLPAVLQEVTTSVQTISTQ